MWLRDYHFDGLRIDAVHAIVDTSALHFLEQLTLSVQNLEIELGRHLILIAESDLNNPRLIRPLESGGYGLDAQWNEDFHHALHALLTNEQERYYQDFGKLADLAKVLTQNQVYDGRYSPFRHRRHGRPASDLSAHKFVGCLQNHDQIGNRAHGNRTSHLVSTEKLKMGAALVFTSPFLPMLFQGEEWGASSPFLYFTDHHPELGEAVYQGRKKEFSDFASIKDIPHPQDEKTFLQSQLRWEELGQAPHAEILAWHRSLIQLRHQLPELKSGRVDSVDFDESKRWMVLKRGPFLLVCNFADSPQKLPFPADRKLLLSSNEGLKLENHSLFLPANSVALFN